MRRATCVAPVAVILALAATVVCAEPPARTASLATLLPRRGPRESGQPVIEWNQVLLGIVRTPGAQPSTVHPTRSFAIVHAAIYDAVNAIDRSRQPYRIFVSAPRGASETAAADAAAHAALVGLYPTLASMLDGDYAAMLTQVPDGPGKDAGIRVGELVAHDLLAIRDDDGSSAEPPPFVAGSDPGDYRPTPPSFPAPVFTHWGQVRPFVLERGDELRPEPPPALTSAEYAAAINEVKSLGSATSTTRSAEQTEIGKFWAAPIQNYWNEIAQTVAVAQHSDLPTSARLFAALDLAFADAAIAFYDAKYTYHLWRPITAIRLADSDGNPQTEPDPLWTPLATTPADPSYPGAHSVVSAAAAEVLLSFFGDHGHLFRFSVSSEVLPGVVRSFTSFAAAAEEAGISRIYAGIHTRLDHVAGRALGREVGDRVLANALLPAD
jgi:membrane-associated phospholipid phosphatase